MNTGTRAEEQGLHRSDRAQRQDGDKAQRQDTSGQLREAAE